MHPPNGHTKHPPFPFSFFRGRRPREATTPVEMSFGSEVLGLDGLRNHARWLGNAHEKVLTSQWRSNSLLSRLADNERALREFNKQTLEAEKIRSITPAAEWLLDNFHLIEEQVRMARRHLPRGFSRELPILAQGGLAGHPRVYEIAQELISHIDGRIEAVPVAAFVAAYQEKTTLKLGELWAIPIALRLALIDNLRRTAETIADARHERDRADRWAERIAQTAEKRPSDLIIVLGEIARDQGRMSRPFAAEFWRSLQEKAPSARLAMSWFEGRLTEEGLSTDQLVQSESQHQAATQVFVGNCITSLRFLDTTDWTEFVESQSAVERTLRLDPAGIHAAMDFATRDCYRHVVERIAFRAKRPEVEVAETTVRLAREAASHIDERRRHVGYHLIGPGRRELDRRLHPKSSWLPNFAKRHRLLLYLGCIGAIMIGVTVPFVRWTMMRSDTPAWVIVLLASLALLCASQFAVSLVNLVTSLIIRPTHLPRLDFTNGVPAHCATLVAVPTMLTNLRGIDPLIDGLEVRYLANRDNHVFFGLLTDFSDAGQEFMPGDEDLLDRAAEGIRLLNEKYRADRPSVFFLFHRPRKWNPAEGVWMGYERKRGKLSELNRLLRGGSPDGFSRIVGDLSTLPRIQYVITLDTDTQLPREAARQLVATMAHPLNRPVYDAKRGLIVEGYSILQPRVAVSLPGADQSLFVRLFAGDPGVDPYTRAVSDVYQDVFHEGTFIGKGIYDVDAFEQAVGGRFPENRILSHDLLEGSYARSALVTDVQLFEDAPIRFNLDAKRRHRWIRGDWQIATWLLPRLPGPDVRRVQNPLTGLSRWKIFDNLRRSLLPAALFALLVFGWISFPVEALVWTAFIAGVCALPGLLSVVADLARKPPDAPIRMHLRNVLAGAGKQLSQAALTLVFLPYDAPVSLDAIVRTLGRLVFTRRKLLEWQTASEVERREDGSLSSFLSSMWGAPVIALAVGSSLVLIGDGAWKVALPFVAAWLVSPVVAWWISRPIADRRSKLTPQQALDLRRLAWRTWRYFADFAGAQDHWLPPDNFQENPQPALATRTSPTNVGLALLGAMTAHDFGFASFDSMTERIERTFDTLDRLERHRGHFFNWYDTRTLEVLPPRYLSTVDNGNFAGHLLTLQAGLIGLADSPWEATRVASGLGDALNVLRECESSPSVRRSLDAMAEELAAGPATLAGLSSALERWIETASAMDENDEFAQWRDAFVQCCREHCDEIRARFPWAGLLDRINTAASGEGAAGWLDLVRQLGSPPALRLYDAAADEWLETLESLSADTAEKTAALSRDLRPLIVQARNEARVRTSVLEDLARRAEAFARMDFTMLFDKSRDLFSIGYDVNEQRLDPNCYDLLASEARLASFVAIAFGQVPQQHWFMLGRLLTTVEGRPTLISWSGTMFEYLMPMLVMPTQEGTLLEVSCRSAVARQISYGAQLGVPWGISESGYNLRDLESSYQYRAFGVPGLGFKRGLSGDIVIAPYATVMALMVSTQEALQNLRVLSDEGAAGRYGLYEAIDYTVARVPRGKTHAVVQSFMAHHQGMSLLALAHVLLDRLMQRRFASHPVCKSAELLLHERVPKGTSVLYPHEFEADGARKPPVPSGSMLRIFTNPDSGPPEAHLLSNGRYHVMISNSGGGYSRWRDVALTRWREDATRDHWGTFLYLRDTDRGDFWSAAHQPAGAPARGYEAVFSQGRAEFRLRRGGITAHTEIAVSPEDDVEVRRVKLSNQSEVVRTIEVTSYAEVVLAPAAADLAHPAFSNLFVQTKLLRDKYAVLVSRRPREAGEKPPWMAHVLLVDGPESGEASFETNRARFLGRGRDVRSPAALLGPPALGQSEGSVLDPAVAIRRTVRLEPRETAFVTLVSCAAATEEETRGLVEKYQSQMIVDRCFELAWTHGLVVLRHLNATEPDAQIYGRLAGAVLFNRPERRATPAVIQRNRRGQRSLWSFGISGDRPIVLVTSTRADRLEFVRQILHAHAYWRMKGLHADLVILSAEDSTYRNALHDLIVGLITSSPNSQLIDQPGGVFTRRIDQVSAEDRILFEAAAHVVLHDENGPLAEQLKRGATAPTAGIAPVKQRTPAPPEPPSEPMARELIFNNGTGGFTPDGREYVMTLRAGQTTPAPWVNVLANPEFGTLVSESGGSYTWRENCHEFRLTPWHNDAVTDASGEAFYLRDEQTGRFWSPTPLPARGPGTYVTRHGFGYTVFEYAGNGVQSEFWHFVATGEPVKVALLKLRNLSSHMRTLSVTGCVDWVLGDLPSKHSRHVVTQFDGMRGAILARNYYNTDFEGRMAFFASTERPASHTGDRTEFIGRNRSSAQPDGLLKEKLGGRTGAGWDPCAALQLSLTLAPGEEREVAFILGAGRTIDDARRLIDRFRSLDACHTARDEVWEFWNRTLGTISVETPEPSFNVLANGWLLYQTLACRLWARTGFYQSGGAFGFRDQLQDSMALVHAHPADCRAHLLRAAAHQFRKGDVQHWWHPPHDRGVRTHFSDDFLWLPYATARYVTMTGDTGVLDESVTWLEARELRPEEEANFDTPESSIDAAPLYDHCVVAIEQGLRFGPHGLPLIGCGDWNDGMNQIGADGRGESVWLAFFLHDVLRQFGPLARRRGDEHFARRCESTAASLHATIEREAWDGGWYRRAYFDDGTPLGSSQNPECQIDSLPQSWATLSEVGDPARRTAALEAVHRRLVRREAGLIQLFDPPFDTSSLEPGYIKGYVPGVRENGGQYTHAAIWTVMATALAGDTARAWELWQLINPVLHALDPEGAARYKVEPYVVAADVYSLPPHAGSGGWTWYTGSAGWTYRLLVETFLGLTLEVDRLRFQPRAPAEWERFTVHYRYRETVYHIELENLTHSWQSVPVIVLDGNELPDPWIPLVDDRREHRAGIRFA